MAIIHPIKNIKGKKISTDVNIFDKVSYPFMKEKLLKH